MYKVAVRFLPVFMTLYSFQGFAMNDEDCLGSFMPSWTHEFATASVKNPYVTMPSGARTRLFRVTSLGGGFDQAVGRTRYSQDSRWLAGELANGKLRVWNLELRSDFVVEVPGHRIYSFDFSPDSTLILVRLATIGQSPCCGGGNSVQLFDLKTGKAASAEIATTGSHATAYWSPNGKWLLAESNGVYRIHDGHTGTDLKREFPVLTNFSMIGDDLLRFGEKGQAVLSSLSNGKDLVRVGIGEDFSADGQIVEATGIAIIEDIFHQDPNGLLPILRDSKTLQPLPIQLSTDGIGPDLHRVGGELSPHGRYVYSTFYSKNETTKKSFGVLWDTKTGAQVVRIDNAGAETVYSLDENYLAVTARIGRDSEEIVTRLIHLPTNKARTIPGTPLRRGHGFFGSTLITRVTNDGIKNPNIAIGYYLTDTKSGVMRHLDNQGHEIIFSPNGKSFFYVEHGAIRLFESNAASVH